MLRVIATIRPLDSASGMKAAGGKHRAVAFLPAHQHLGAAQPSVGDVDDRLIIGNELAAPQCALDLGHRIVSLAHPQDQRERDQRERQDTGHRDRDLAQIVERDFAFDLRMRRRDPQTETIVDARVAGHSRQRLAVGRTRTDFRDNGPVDKSELPVALEPRTVQSDLCGQNIRQDQRGETVGPPGPTGLRRRIMRAG